MSLYINSIIAKKSKVSYAIRIGLLYEKIFGRVWNHRILRYPPLKKFRQTVGLKSLSEKGLKRKSKRITVRKNGGTLYPSQLDATIKE